MPPLPDDLRNQLERAVIAARDKAEEGARAALQRLDVDKVGSKVLAKNKVEARDKLRAHARQLGDEVPAKGPQRIDRLVAECAYEFWHRMLFARFLAENQLLIHPEHKVSIPLQDLEELAAEKGIDGWTFASRCAAGMLPQIFRPDDPLLQVPFAPEHKLALEQILAGLPSDVFTADDSLGWVYQFWQTKRKKEVNESEVKIGGDELPAVTQLFTEHYMVLFLLHNTLGAWWVGKEAAAGRKPADVKLSGYPFEYLRFRDDGTPATGTFPGWPREACELKVLDPCCGSGHFLVAAFELLVRIRMHDEKLSARDACDAVLRDNLFGLELDARCTQIAAFNLALAAWKFDGAGGYRPLPQLHIACSGQAPKGKREDWKRLAAKDQRLAWGMDLLYDLFEKANDLGSLIDPRAVKAAPSMVGSFDELQPLLQRALQREEVLKDPELAAAGVAAQGIARAVELLQEKYGLVATNVPYLAMRKQGTELRTFIDKQYPITKDNLAATFVARCLKLCLHSGTLAVVSLQNWLFLGSYADFRKQLLSEFTWNMLAQIGEKGFASSQAAGAFVAMSIVTSEEPVKTHAFWGIDVSDEASPSSKAAKLLTGAGTYLSQWDQLKNPDHRLAFGEVKDTGLLEKYAIAPQGIKTGDDDRWRRCFWELGGRQVGWEFYQSTVEENGAYGGRHYIIDWRTEGEGMVRPRIKNAALKKKGVAISQMRELPVTLYTGERFDSNVAPIVPHNPDHLPALWAFCRSDLYHLAVRRIDQKTGVTNATLLKVPFDLAHWQAVAGASGPLPEPHSNDPTQWLFKGDVATADAPQNLQAAVARLLGYRWPDQPADKLDDLADDDGIVCLPAIAKEKGADERLRELLAVVYGPDWSPARQESLLAAVGYGGKSLGEWLRDGFFEQHCKLFHQRPFVWHIWDGKKDGFSALVNYHKFGRRELEKLIHHHLGWWLKKQDDAVKKGEPGSDARYAAALGLQKKLKLILEGDCAPDKKSGYDIFVRWKPLDKQPIGWEPDLNDGVRMNIRPLVEADVLRKKPNIKWGKDKGRDPKSAPWYKVFEGDRINDHHLSLKEKQAARGQGGKS